jgi:hypothetical protein
MAFIFFVAGGIAGMIAMLTAMIGFDASFLSALALWFGTGMVISLAGIALAMVPRAEAATGEFAQA